MAGRCSLTILSGSSSSPMVGKRLRTDDLIHRLRRTRNGGHRHSDLDGLYCMDHPAVIAIDKELLALEGERMKIELVQTGDRGLVSRGHRVEMTWIGAEVDTLYRVYRDYYGPHDVATADVFVACVNRHDYTENLDLIDARTVADALEAVGLDATATRVRSVAGYKQAA
jgi:hypothetical protein